MCPCALASDSTRARALVGAEQPQPEHQPKLQLRRKSIPSLRTPWPGLPESTPGQAKSLAEAKAEMQSMAVKYAAEKELCLCVMLPVPNANQP